MDNLLDYYLKTTDPHERQRLLVNYPILLSDVVEQLLVNMNSRLIELQSRIATITIPTNIALLDDCKRRGLEEVFPEAFPAGLGSLPCASNKKMVAITGGEFPVGSDLGDRQKRESPRRSLHLPDFSIDKYPVTNAEYGRFILETGYPIDERQVGMEVSSGTGEPSDYPLLNDLQALLGDIGSRGFKLTWAHNRADYPVVEISWHDALEFSRWAGKRLPTADEWEKAARGIDQRNWSWGKEPDSSKGNTRESGPGHTTPVSNYDKWRSPYGCCDMSGNVMEWTSTLASGSEGEAGDYVIKGGCWSFAIEEAQVWKRHDDPPDDLWDALGFRCCGAADRPSREQQLKNYNDRVHASEFRKNLGVGINDHPSVIGILAIAEAVMSKEQTIEEAEALLVKTMRDPRMPPGAGREMVTDINRYVISSTPRQQTSRLQAPALIIVALLGVRLAEEFGDSSLVAQTLFTLGKAQVFGLDFFEAVQNLENCLSICREHPEDERQLALTLLALGSAEANYNQTIGEELLSAKEALKHISEAVPLLVRLGMRVEEQEALCALAEVHRLHGQPQRAFDLARLALSKTIDLKNVADEIRGILHVGDVYLDIHRYDHALYCFGMAHRLAAKDAETELVIEARLRVFQSLTLSDRNSAARYGAETLEAIIFFESDSLQPALNILYNAAVDKIAGWVIGSLLANLVVASRREDFSLFLLPLVECAMGFSLRVPELIGECAVTLEGLTKVTLTPTEEFFVTALLALTLISSDPERARRLADRAVEAARLSCESLYVLVSQQIRVEVFKELGFWDEAVAGIAEIRPEFLRLGQSELLVAYLEYEAHLCFWGGNVSAALEACDEAWIKAEEILDSVTASRNVGNLYVLRSRILSAIGSRTAFIESEGANLCFSHAGDRLGSARYMIRQAQVILDPAFEGREMLRNKAVERLQLASNILGGKTLGLTDEPAVCELIYTIGLLYVEAQDFEKASEQFTEAYARAKAVEHKELQIKALTKSAETALVLGERETAEHFIIQALALAGQLKRPFETISVLIQAGCVYSDSLQLAKAHDAFRQALELYKTIRKSIRNNPIERKAWLRKNLKLFDQLVNDVLLKQGRVEEAFLVVQMSKAAALHDLLWESRLVTAQGLPAEKASQARLLWREIRQREISLERESAYVGDEPQQYRMRVELRSLREQWSRLWENKLNDEDYPELTGHDLNQIWELIPGDSVTAFVEFFVTPKQVLAFLLTPGVDSQAVVQLDHINGEQLEQIITEDLIEPYRTFRYGTDEGQIEDKKSEAMLFSRLEALLSNLYALLLSSPGRNGQSVLDILIKLNTENLVLIPSGTLSRIPLHALCTVVDGKPHYILDEFRTVSFTPSISTFRLGLSQPRRRFRTLMAVQDPDGTLPNGTGEVRILRRLFTDSVVLASEQATKKRVMEALTQADFVHFACHGAFDAVSPLDSGLVLSDEILSLAQIYLDAKLKPGCLVTLAACESGLVDLSFADEFLGLPSGLIFAGAAGVVSTLWVVNDLSTMLLMERFYINQLDGMSLASALKESQLWLRTVTAGELAARFNNERRKSGQEWPLPAEQVSRAWRHFAAMEPSGARPFEHPFFWAPFTVNGC